jgi:DNA polymerase-3 subunit gamma/tau
VSLFAEDLPATQAGSASPGAPAYRVLARKYRPASLDDLIGQEVLVRILRNAFALDRVPHAFMLTGVRGVGKTTTARIIARCLNCIGPDGAGGPTATPCGVCANCTAILADRHPDVTEMDAASHTGIDDVREIIEATRFRPLQARRRVFIVDEVHMLSKHAFNALLKTLEEPPPHVSFVFATTEIRKVPVTVLSRCMRFDLRRISAAELTRHFGRIAAAEGVTAEPEALALIARAADGSVRDGLSLLDQAIAQAADGSVTGAAVADMLGLADRGAVFDMMEALVAGDAARVLAISERAHEYGADAGVILTDLMELVYTLTRLKLVPALRSSLELPEAERTRGAALADRLDIPTLGRAWQMLLKGVTEVESASDRRAAGEMILVRLCHVAELPPPGDLVRQLAAPATARPTRAAPVGASGNGATALAALPAAAPRPVALPEPAAPKLAGLRDVAMLAAARREPQLHAHLLHSVHEVRFAPGVIELRPEPSAPRELGARLAALLLEATGTRWTIALSAAAGQPTLAEQDAAADAERRRQAALHPLVRSILDAFPGAVVEPVRAAAALPQMAELDPTDDPERADEE